MDFKLTEEQLMIRSSIREFCEKYIEPIAEEIDREGRYPLDNMKKLGEKGFLGVPYGKEYGGAGADLLSYMIVIEEVSRACASTGISIECHTSLASFPIFAYGTEEQKQKFLRPLCTGEKLAGFALTEPTAGTDVGGALTTAVLDGDDYVINGSKIFISNAYYSGILTVFALTDPSKGNKGISAFAVPSDTPGITISEPMDKLGIRASAQSEIFFKDVRVPKANLLGKEGEGFKIAMHTLDGGRIGIAAQALGIAQAALDESIRYAKERKQFGKPIASFQAIQWMIAEMAKDVAAARLLTYHAAWCYDQGLPYSEEAAIAKLFASEAAARHTNKAIQVFGGIGFIKGSKVERLYRDAKITEIYEGTSEVMKMVISGKELH
jgi:butyryl-CoA dehydrogenase